MRMWAEEMGNAIKRKKDKKLLFTLAEGIQVWRDSLVALDGDGYVAESEAIREEISTLYLQISQFSR